MFIFKKPFFSIILSTYNRAFCICNTIDSVLQQSYQKFELIIVDDGSCDNTETLIIEKYSKFLFDKKIKYFKINHSGSSEGRNYGLDRARGNWCCYIDSDNQIKPNFLETYARNICRHPRSIMFYSDFYQNNLKVSHKFNFAELMESNYIDLGVFVHKRNLFIKYGGFDPKLKRLIDYDLILKFIIFEYPKIPFYIEENLMTYNDRQDITRITNSEDFEKNYKIVKINQMAYFEKRLKK